MSWLRVIPGVSLAALVLLWAHPVALPAHPAAGDLLHRHWAGRCYDAECRVLSLRDAGPYDSEDYRWGGYAEGFVFYRDGTAQEYRNTFCSDETDPAASFLSAWDLSTSGVLTVTGRYFTARYRLLSWDATALELELEQMERRDTP